MTTLIIAAIALVCGLLIYLAYVKIPQKVKGLEKTEEINSILPGINCGSCGYPGCFGFAEALTKNPELIYKGNCAFTVQDEQQLKQLGEALGLSLDAASLRKKAVIKCTGNSAPVYDYRGTQTCKANSLFFRGNRQCPYSCLGLGDCAQVCPVSAITIDSSKHIAVIDAAKCTGCGLCVAQCPQNLIELVSGATKVVYMCNYQQLRDIPGREKCDFGCIHCRKCFKACEEENVHAITWDKSRARPVIDQGKCTLCGSCIAVCPQHTLAAFSRVKSSVRS